MKIVKKFKFSNSNLIILNTVIIFLITLFSSVITFIFVSVEKEAYPFEKKLSNLSERLKFSLKNYKYKKNPINLLNPEIISNSEFINTAWHNLEKDTINANNYLYDYYSEKNKSLPGGYIEFLKVNEIIGTNGKGEFFIFNIKNKRFKSLSSNLKEIFDKQNYDVKLIPNLRGSFGLRDIYLDNDRKNLYASIHIDINGKGCYGMSIFRAKIGNYMKLDKENSLKFNEFFRTKECNSKFNGHASGGRIKELNNKIIFTVGSYDLNLYGDINIPQSKNNAIGKVIQIDKDGNFEVISMGHRNQQGLAIFDQKIFITEHGPKGGDEINLIEMDSHYGWPFYSYAFDYGDLDKFRYPHERPYEKPIFYFTPSIAISEIVFYEGNEFSRWQNKFIVTSLKDKSIYLLDFDKENNSIISSEKIFIGHRIRDITLDEKGKIYLITDDQKIIRLAKSKIDLAIKKNKVNFNKLK